MATMQKDTFLLLTLLTLFSVVISPLPVWLSLIAGISYYVFTGDIKMKEQAQ
jgi:hypothetical protein